MVGTVLNKNILEPRKTPSLEEAFACFKTHTSLSHEGRNGVVPAWCRRYDINILGDIERLLLLMWLLSRENIWREPGG